MKTLFGTAAALGLALIAGAATAQTAPSAPPVISPAPAAVANLTADETADLQCMALFAIMANQPEHVNSAAVGIFYYWGRLEGRKPGVDWLGTLSTYADTVTGEELQPHADRCSQALVSKGQQMAALAPQTED